MQGAAVVPNATPAVAGALPPSPLPGTQLPATRPDEAPPPALAAAMPVRRRAKLKVLLVVFALLAVLGGGAAVYAFAVAPLAALPNYLARLTSAKTARFATSANVDYAGDYQVKLKLAGKYDLHDQAKPKVETTIQGDFKVSDSAALPDGATHTGTMSGEIRLLPPALYFKIGQFDLLTSLLGTKVSEDWYKLEIPADQTAGKCLGNQQNSSAIFGSQVLTDVPVKNAAFKGFAMINGATTMHYAGTIDNAKLKAAVDRANAELSADCKFDFKPDSLKDIVISYELWHGWSSDRLIVRVNDTGAKTVSLIGLDTSDYDDPVVIDAPAGAKDAQSLLSNLADDTGTDIPSSRKNVPATTTATTVQKARDTQRKTDLLITQRLLEVYFVDHGAYPKTLKELTNAPVDPANVAPFVYIYTPTTGTAKPGYKLQACLENAADTTPHVIDPVAPCTTATLERVSAQ